MSIECDVLDFISTEAGIDRYMVKLSASISDDLGIDGDDASDLLAAYTSRFNVDMTRFRYSEYFTDEGTLTPFSLLGIIAAWLSGRRSSPKRPLFVRDLVASAMVRRWT